MKPCTFSQAQFVSSALSSDSLPLLKANDGSLLPEIVLIGRSNVGKSSLINHLLKRKDLARVSATPGKTQTLNFFTVDQQLALVDLPGYGYAKATDDLKRQWAGAIDHYLNNRQNLKLILFLMDCRRQPTEEDLAFVQWALHQKIPLLVIFTKSDKLSENEQRLNTLNSFKLFNTYLQKTSFHLLHYSVKNSKSRGELIDHINAMLNTPAIQPE